MTFSHLSIDHLNRPRHHWNRLLRWRTVKYGFLTATHPKSPYLRKVLLTVLRDTPALRLHSCRVLLAVHVGVPFEVRTTRRSIFILKRRGLPHHGRSAILPLSLNFFMMYWTERRLIQRDLEISFCVSPSLKNCRTKLYFSAEIFGIFNFEVSMNDLFTICRGMIFE